MSNPSDVPCRAQESERCYDGLPVDFVYPEGISTDETWDGFSVICESCFIAKGGYTEDVESYGVKRP